MKTRILLSARDEATKNKFLEAIGQSDDIHIDAVSTLTEVFQTLIHTPYNGILIDLATKIKATETERDSLNVVFDEFPAALIIFDAEHAAVRLLFSGKRWLGRDADRNLTDFITKDCGEFPARRIRASKRKLIHFNVMISPYDRTLTGADDSGEKSVTYNVSDGGCFIYSTQRWKNNDTVWFILKEIDPQLAIEGRITWTVPWGKSMAIPGIGIQFTTITDDQKAKLAEYLSQIP